MTCAIFLHILFLRHWYTILRGMLILSVLFLPTHPSLHLYEVALHMFRIVVTKLFPVCNAGFDAVEQLQYDVLGRFICPELTVRLRLSGGCARRIRRRAGIRAAWRCADEPCRVTDGGA